MDISLINLVLLALLVFFFLKWKKEKKRNSKPNYQQAPVQVQPQQTQYFEDDIPFEERHGALHCSGTLCSSDPDHYCSEPERLMCRDLISKVLKETISEEHPPKYFKGQFPVQLPYSGQRFPDFAIETKEGKRIIVELDGFKTHIGDVKNQEQFKEQLLRQNEFVLAGWTVLRFSFNQLKENLEQCQKLLEKATKMPPVFTDDFNNTKLLTKDCIYNGCNGIAVRIRAKKGHFFWECKTCGKTFSDSV